MSKHIFTRIEELFKEALQEKTGWGKNDVLVIYQNCVKQAFIEREKENATNPNLAKVAEFLNSLKQEAVASGRYSLAAEIKSHVDSIS